MLMYWLLIIYKDTDILQQEQVKC